MADIWMNGEVLRSGRAFETGLGGALARLGRWAQVARERRRLRGLDPHLLRDIGLERDAALEESARAFYDLPASRR